jgi:hypothetical protein
MIDTSAAAARIGVTVQRMQQLCRERRVAGAKMIGRSWFVPEDFAVKPGKRGPKLGR